MMHTCLQQKAYNHFYSSKSDKSDPFTLIMVEVLVIIQYSALVVRSGYTGNVVVLRVACTKW